MTPVSTELRPDDSRRSVGALPVWPFELQPAERRVLASGAPVHVGPHAFDLLVALVERSGYLVSKDELLQRVWGKVVVEENTLQVHVSALRKVLGTDAIATVSGRGYRFVPEVVCIRVASTSDTRYENTIFRTSSRASLAARRRSRRSSNCWPPRAY